MTSTAPLGSGSERASAPRAAMEGVAGALQSVVSDLDEIITKSNKVKTSLQESH